MIGPQRSGWHGPKSVAGSHVAAHVLSVRCQGQVLSAPAFDGLTVGR